MKVYMKPIESIVWFNLEGIPQPIKFRLTAEDYSYQTIKITRVLHRTEEKVAGNRMLLFRCEGEVNGTFKILELKYELQSCKWYLYKL